MAIVIDIELMADRYDAGAGSDPKAPEWPPHPARVVSALMAAAEGEEDTAALRMLERMEAPVVRASEEFWESGTSGYVVTNRLEGKSGHQTYPGRTSGLRERRRVFPKSSRVQIVWDVDPEQETVRRLDKLCGQVPYLGRSTSPVLISATRVNQPPIPDGLTAFTPCTRDEADTWLRVPYPGYVDELESLFGSGLSAWLASDGGRALRPYRRGAVQVANAGTDAASQSPYRDLVVLKFDGAFPEGRQVNLFTSALRSLVMRQTHDPLPAALHGHGADGVPHVAYLGLPTIGHKNADGHLVGLAVAIPQLEESERVRILRGAVGRGQETFGLAVPGLRRPVTLRYAPVEVSPRAATAERWSSPSQQWVTATPIVLDRFPKVRGSLSLSDAMAVEVGRSCCAAGLPAPIDVTVSRHPLIPGAVDLSPLDLPRRARGRLFCHARIQFEHRLSGPVLVGAGRYFGVGLLSPEGLS